MQQRIPNPVSAVVGQILGQHYYSHRRLDALFAAAGAPGDSPPGSCVDKSVEWLKRTSADASVDALSVLGKVLEEFMEVDTFPSPDREPQRATIRQTLQRYGLTYHLDGRVLGSATAAPTRSLDEKLRKGGLESLEDEFNRAQANVEGDPPAAVTAACAIVESVCKVVLEDDGVPLPSDQTIKPLWKAAQAHLGLDPASVPDNDLKRILSGLTSVVDGLGAYRTHVGSAHGRGTKVYRPGPRHARLALHAAHTLTLFVLETRDMRKAAQS